MSLVRITVDGREVLADPKKPLIHACHESGVAVPHYCYHPGLSPVGSCRICQVEVQQGELPRRVVVACRTPVAEGMVVETESAKARETRRECLEFLLKNHPLDCPICDKAGECDLQDYSFREGQAKGRTHEPRRKLEKRHGLGEVIVLDQERCILCSRCVRFFEEVTKKPQLTVSQRGAHSVIETFGDRPLTGNYQGNIADLCPVGALTLKRFRFQARVWNLYKRASSCVECSRGCAITIESLRGGEVKRLRPRYDEKVNRWWMCDAGRFAYAGANVPGRLAGALMRGYGGLERVELADALAAARDMLVAHEPRVLVASPFLTNEEGAALLELARALGTQAIFVSPPPNGLGDELLHTGDPCPNRRGLEQLGIEGLSSEEIADRLGAAGAALLVGERVAELVGREALAQLPAALRLVVLDCKPLDVAAVDVCIGLPTWVERSGTFLNVDGIPRVLAAARSAPAGVRDTQKLLGELCALLTRAEARP